MRRLRWCNRSLAAGMVALTLFLADAAVRSFPGHARAAPAPAVPAAGRAHHRRQRARRTPRRARHLARYHHRPAAVSPSSTTAPAPAAPSTTQTISPPAAPPQAAPAPAPATVVSGGS